jgi:conjugal transfer/entry exclusion protein
MNNLAKSYTDYHKSIWVQLSKNLYKLVTDQSQEVEKAVIGMGEYHFKPAYQHLNVDTTKWFNMSPEQRQKHMKKVISFCVLL